MSHPVSDLIAKIQSTNNYYLFAPMANEIAVAKAHPTVFTYEYNPANEFKHKIMLK